MFYATASHFEEYYPNMGRAFYKVRPACPASRSRSALAPSCPHPRQACTEPECDVILVTAMTISLGLDLGEALHKPVWACKLAPDIPTRAYPPPGMTAAALPIGNLLKHYLYWGRVGAGPAAAPRRPPSPPTPPSPPAAAGAAGRSNLTELENAFRRDVLGLGCAAPPLAVAAASLARLSRRHSLAAPSPGCSALVTSTAPPTSSASRPR